METSNSPKIFSSTIFWIGRSKVKGHIMLIAQKSERAATPNESIFIHTLQRDCCQLLQLIISLANLLWPANFFFFKQICLINLIRREKNKYLGVHLGRKSAPFNCLSQFPHMNRFDPLFQLGGCLRRRIRGDKSATIDKFCAFLGVVARCKEMSIT